MVPSPQRPSLTTPAHTKIPDTTFFFAPSYIPPRTPASPPQGSNAPEMALVRPRLAEKHSLGHAHNAAMMHG